MSRPARRARALLALALAIAPAPGRAEPAQAPRWDAVGRIQIAGYNRSAHCSGALVAPDLVLTAAHCLIHPKTKKPVRAEDAHFLAGADRGAYREHGRARRLCFLGAEARLTEDAALIRLRAPLETPPVAIAAAPLSPGARVGAAGYPRPRSQILSVQEDCRLRGARGALLEIDCAAAPGGSGGPLFVLRERERRIAGLVVAAGRDADGPFTIALAAAAWRGLVETAARRCP